MGNGDPVTTANAGASTLPVSVGTSSDLPVDDKSSPPVKKVEIKKPFALTTTANLAENDEYKKLIASAKSLGVKLDFLDEHGFIKPEKVEEFKKFLQGVVQKDGGMTLSLANWTGIDIGTKKNTVSFLQKDTGFSLLPLKDQIAFLQEEPLKFSEEEAKSLVKTDKTDRQRFSLALRLKAIELDSKPGIENTKDAARIFEKASELNPDDLSLHYDTARTQKAWADEEKDPKVKETLYQQALGHLKIIASKDKNDTLALSLTAEILKAQGKPEEAKKIQGEILRVRLEEFDEAMAEFNQLRATKPDKADVLLDRLERKADKLLSAEAASPEQNFEKLKRVRAFLNGAIDFRNAHIPSQSVFDSKEYDAHESGTNILRGKLKGVNAALREFRDTQYLPKTKLEAGKPSTPEQIATIRLMIQIDKELDDQDELARDLGTAKLLMDSLPYEAVSKTERMEFYSQILKDWLQLRDTVVSASYFIRPITLDGKQLDGNMVTQKMRDVSDRLLEVASSSIEGKDVRDNLSLMINRVIDLDDHRLLSQINAAGLESYAKQSAAADAALEKAKGIQTLPEKRGALLLALGQYVQLRQSAKIDEVLKLIDSTFPKDAKDTDRLQMLTAEAQALKGSGLSQFDALKTKGAELARMMPVCSSDPALRVKRLVLAESFYETVGDAKGQEQTKKELKELGDKLINFLRGGDPAANIPKPTDPKARIELASLAVQIDQILLPDYVTEASKEGGVNYLQGMVAARMEVWRKEIEKAKDLPPEFRLEQLSQLARVSATYQSLTQGEKPLLKAEELKNINNALEPMMGQVFTELMAQGPGASEGQKKMAESITSDMKSRFHLALENGDAKWLSNLTPASLKEFGEYSQSANALMISAAGVKGPQALQRYLQAAQIFSQLGLKDRVAEAAKPVLEYAKGLKDPAAQANIYLAVAQMYQGGSMTKEAAGLFDQVIALDKEGAAPQIHEVAQLARGMKELNEGNLDKAQAYLLTIPKNEAAKVLLANLQDGNRKQRLAYTVGVLRAVSANFIQRGRDNNNNMDAIEADTNAAWGEVQRMLANGECAKVTDAIARVKASGQFPGFRTGISGNFNVDPMKQDTSEYTIGSFSGYFLQIAENPATSDLDFAKAALDFGGRLEADGYYSGAGQVYSLFTQHPLVKDQAKGLVEGLPDSVKIRSIIGAIPVPFTSGSLGADAIEGNAFKIAQLIVPFGVARVFAIGAEAVFVARAATLIENPALMKLATFGVRTSAEALGFTLTNMTLQTLFTGKTDQWSFGHFGKEFGSMLVTFVLLHGVGMGLARVGKAAEGVPWLRATGEEAIRLQEAGQLALKPGARVAMSVTGWAGRVLAFTGTEYFNEAIGLKKKEDTPFAIRLFGSAVMDAQMVVAGKMVDAMSGGRLSKIEKSTQEQLGQHELAFQSRKLMPVVEKMGIDPQSKAGQVVLSILLNRVSKGEKLGSFDLKFGEETQKDLGESVKKSFGLDPKSPEGQEMIALLFLYSSTKGAKPGEPLKGADLHQAIEKMSESVKSFLKDSGLETGPTSEGLRKMILRFAVESGFSPETMAEYAKHAPELKDRLHDVVNTVMGKGGSKSPEGQMLMAQLLVRAMVKAKNPGELSTSLELLADMGPEAAKSLQGAVEKIFGEGGAQTPEGRRLIGELLLGAFDSSKNAADLTSRLKTVEEMAPDAGDALRSSVNHIFGEGMSRTAEGRQLMTLLFLKTLASVEDPSQIPDKLGEFTDVANDVRDALRGNVSFLLGEKASASPVGRLMMARLFADALNGAENSADLPSVLDRVSDAVHDLSSPTPNLFDLMDLHSPAEKLALVEWAVRTEQNANSLKTLTDRILKGEVELTHEKGEIREKEVPSERREAQKKLMFDRIPLLELKGSELKEFGEEKEKLLNLFRDPKTSMDYEAQKAQLDSLRKTFGADPELKKEIEQLERLVDSTKWKEKGAVEDFENGFTVRKEGEGPDAKYFQDRKYTIKQEASGNVFEVWHPVQVDARLYHAYERWAESLPDVTEFAQLIDPSSAKLPPKPKAKAAAPAADVADLPAAARDSAGVRVRPADKWIEINDVDILKAVDAPPSKTEKKDETVNARPVRLSGRDVFVGQQGRRVGELADLAFKAKWVSEADLPELKKALAQMVASDVHRTENLESTKTRDELIVERAKNALEIAKRFKLDGRHEFMKALGVVVVENIRGTERLMKDYGLSGTSLSSLALTYGGIAVDRNSALLVTEEGGAPISFGKTLYQRARVENSTLVFFGDLKGGGGEGRFTLAVAGEKSSAKLLPGGDPAKAQDVPGKGQQALELKDGDVIEVDGKRFTFRSPAFLERRQAISLMAARFGISEGEKFLDDFAANYHPTPGNLRNANEALKICDGLFSAFRGSSDKLTPERTALLRRELLRQALAGTLDPKTAQALVEGASKRNFEPRELENLLGVGPDLKASERPFLEVFLDRPESQWLSDFAKDPAAFKKNLHEFNMATGQVDRLMRLVEKGRMRPSEREKTTDVMTSDLAATGVTLAGAHGSDLKPVVESMTSFMEDAYAKGLIGDKPGQFTRDQFLGFLFGEYRKGTSLAAAEAKVKNVFALKEEWLFLANSKTPFADNAKKAIEADARLPQLRSQLAKMGAQDPRRKALTSQIAQDEKTLSGYREAQTEIGRKMVGEHKDAFKFTLDFIEDLKKDKDVRDFLVSIPLDDQGRLKDPSDIAPKLVRRKMNDLAALTDIAGTTIVIRDYSQAPAVIAKIKGAVKPDGTPLFKIRAAYDSEGEVMVTDDGRPAKDWDTIGRMIVGSKTGYRAIHLVVEVDGKPVEIQIKTQNMYEWGKIQHHVYKNKADLTPELFGKVNEYFKKVSDYLSDCELGSAISKDGQRIEMPPRPELPPGLKEKFAGDFDATEKLMGRAIRITDIRRNSDIQHEKWIGELNGRLGDAKTKIGVTGVEKLAKALQDKALEMRDVEKILGEGLSKESKELLERELGVPHSEWIAKLAEDPKGFKSAFGEASRKVNGSLAVVSRLIRFVERGDMADKKSPPRYSEDEPAANKTHATEFDHICDALASALNYHGSKMGGADAKGAEGGNTPAVLSMVSIVEDAQRQGKLGSGPGQISPDQLTQVLVKNYLGSPDLKTAESKARAELGLEKMVVLPDSKKGEKNVDSPEVQEILQVLQPYFETAPAGAREGIMKQIQSGKMDLAAAKRVAAKAELEKAKADEKAKAEALANDPEHAKQRLQEIKAEMKGKTQLGALETEKTIREIGDIIQKFGMVNEGMEAFQAILSHPAVPDKGRTTMLVVNRILASDNLKPEHFESLLYLMRRNLQIQGGLSANDVGYFIWPSILKIASHEKFPTEKLYKQVFSLIAETHPDPLHRLLSLQSLAGRLNLKGVSDQKAIVMAFLREVDSVSFTPSLVEDPFFLFQVMSWKAHKNDVITTLGRNPDISKDIYDGVLKIQGVRLESTSQLMKKSQEAKGVGPRDADLEADFDGPAVGAGGSDPFAGGSYKGALLFLITHGMDVSQFQTFLGEIHEATSTLPPAVRDQVWQRLRSDIEALNRELQDQAKTPMVVNLNDFGPANDVEPVSSKGNNVVPLAANDGTKRAGAKPSPQVGKEPLIFKIGEGEGPGLILHSLSPNPPWRVKEVSADKKSMILENTADPSFTVKASAPKSHPFKVGDGVETFGIGGGGKALPYLEAAKRNLASAKALIAYHESGLGEVSAVHLKSARAYVAAADAGKPAPKDVSFLEGMNDYAYSVKEGKGKGGSLVFARAIEKDGAIPPRYERWRYTVVDVDGGKITLRNEKGETRVFTGIGKEAMPHPFAKGDDVVLLPQVGGGAPLPGEGPGAGFGIEFKAQPNGDKTSTLGSETNPELQGASNVEKQHAQLVFHDGKMYLNDLSDGKGTYVMKDGHWVRLEKDKPEAIKPDQVFSLGPDQFYRLGSDYKVYPVENSFIGEGEKMLDRVKADLSYGQAGQKVDWGSKQDNWLGIAASSDKGLYYKDHNEDRYVKVAFADGRIMTFAIDGMGGHTGGERAAEIARAVIELAAKEGKNPEEAIALAHRAIFKDNKDMGFVKSDGSLKDGTPGAVVVGVEIVPNGDGTYRSRFVTVGDAEAVVIRFPPGGGMPYLIHHTARPTQLVQLMKQVQGQSPFQLTPDKRLARGQTVMFRIDELANRVDSALGLTAPMAVSTPNEPLKSGDLVLTGSDGFFENFGSYEVINWVLARSGATNAAEARDALMLEARIRMSLAKNGKNQPLSHENYVKAYRDAMGQEPPKNWKGMYETYVDGQGQTHSWTLDGSGNVVNKAGVIVDHFKRDNITLMVQVVGQPVPVDVGAPKPPPKPASNVAKTLPMIDPEATQIMIRPAVSADQPLASFMPPEGRLETGQAASEYVIGHSKAQGAFYEINDPAVDPVQATVRQNRFGEWYLYDGAIGGTKSRNGVFIYRNGKFDRVTSPVVLHHGDQIGVRNADGKMLVIPFADPAVSTSPDLQPLPAAAREPGPARPAPRPTTMGGLPPPPKMDIKVQGVVYGNTNAQTDVKASYPKLSNDPLHPTTFSILFGDSPKLTTQALEDRPGLELFHVWRSSGKTVIHFTGEAFSEGKVLIDGIPKGASGTYSLAPGTHEIKIGTHTFQITI